MNAVVLNKEESNEVHIVNCPICLQDERQSTLTETIEILPHMVDECLMYFNICYNCGWKWRIY